MMIFFMASSLLDARWFLKIRVGVVGPIGPALHCGRLLSAFRTFIGPVADLLRTLRHTIECGK
jgi:hypothetical protein